MMASRSCSRVIRLRGLGSNMRRRMASSSTDRGRIVRKKFRFRRYAEYVSSRGSARFHGLRPHVRLTRITPRDQTSLGADA